jgi:hypothetical protein
MAQVDGFPLYSYYSTVFLGADGTGNDKVDASDYNSWVSQFGKKASSSGSAELDLSLVPEPSSMTLLLCGVLAFAIGRIRR